jgi:hypothetical protein
LAINKANQHKNKINKNIVRDFSKDFGRGSNEKTTTGKKYSATVMISNQIPIR